MYMIPEGVTALSFDIWLTLLRGNRHFSRLRLRIIFDDLGYPEVDVERLYDVYRKIDSFLNRKAEEDAVDYGMADRLELMFKELGIVADVPDPEFIQLLQIKVGKFRRQAPYMPRLTEPDLPATLRALRDRGLTLGLLSNTGMDNSTVVEGVLDELGLLEFFSVRIFSSDDGRAKPNPELFQRMVKELGAESSQVLHIGDNAIADYRATEAGLHAVQYAPKGSELTHITSMRELLG